MNPMFYQKPIVLNVKDHKDWKIETVKDYAFAKKTNSVYLLVTEFVLASKEYPIVFFRNNDTVMPIALLGLQKDNNQFIVPKGGWDADYIPAYVRRYPFIPVTKEGSDESMLCIDADYKGLNSKKAKLPLFNQDGNPDVVTQQAMNLLQNFDSENKVTINFCKDIDDLDLFEEVYVEGEDIKLGGFLRINHEKFTNLGAKTVKSLFDSGSLEPVYAHFQSLANLKNLG